MTKNIFSDPGAPLPGSATAKQGLTFLSSYKHFIVQSNPVNKGTGGGGGGGGGDQKHFFNSVPCVSRKKKYFI